MTGELDQSQVVNVCLACASHVGRCRLQTTGLARTKGKGLRIQGGGLAGGAGWGEGGGKGEVSGKGGGSSISPGEPPSPGQIDYPWL